MLLPYFLLISGTDFDFSRTPKHFSLTFLLITGTDFDFSPTLKHFSIIVCGFFLIDRLVSRIFLASPELSELSPAVDCILAKVSSEGYFAKLKK